MTTLQAKKEQLKKLTDGAEITLTDGRLAIFHSVARTKFIYTTNGTRYKGSIENFHSVGNNSKKASSEHIENRLKSLDNAQASYDLVKQAAFGDHITLTDGMVVRFIKVNKSRFLGKDVKTGTQYTIAFGMAVSLKKVDPTDEFVVEMTERKALVNRFAGRTIQTGWGPSIVKKLSNDFEKVTLYEFGTERFDLTFNDFKNELAEHGNL